MRKCAFSWSQYDKKNIAHGICAGRIFPGAAMPRRGLPWAVQIRLLAALLLVAASCESSGSAGLRSRFTLAFSPGALPGKGPDRRRDAAAAGGIMASGSRGRRLSMRQPAITRGLLHPGFPRIGGMPEAAGGAVPLWLPGREGPFACRGSAQGTQGAGVGKQKNQGLRELSVDTLHDRLEALLDEQWQRASVDYGYKPQGAAPGAPAGANVTWGKVKHVVGGFSVVVRMPEEGLAYRMQPMRSVKAGLTWVAFYMMLQEAALDRRAGAEASSADVLFRPDRSVMLGKSASSVRASGGGRRLGWEHMEVAREFQGPRLRHATKRLVYFRHQLLKTSSAAYQQGRCTSADNCPISPTDGGALEGPCMTNGLMFPSHWFWIKVANPASHISYSSTHMNVSIYTCMYTHTDRQTDTHTQTHTHTFSYEGGEPGRHSGREGRLDRGPRPGRGAVARSRRAAEADRRQTNEGRRAGVCSAPALEEDVAPAAAYPSSRGATRQRHSCCSGPWRSAGRRQFGARQGACVGLSARAGRRRRAVQAAVDGRRRGQRHGARLAVGAAGAAALAFDRNPARRPQGGQCFVC